MLKQVVVFTGPSAVGKETLEQELIKDKSLRLAVAISATTRSPRPGEKHGESYYFISHAEFDRLIAKGAFVEWNEHFGNRYGTLKSEIERIRDKNQIPVLEIEVIGAKNILKTYGRDKTLAIFIAPPSIDDLRKRIMNRGSETPLQIEQRLNRVAEEMAMQKIFDCVVINDEVSRAAKELTRILKDPKYGLYN